MVIGIIDSLEQSNSFPNGLICAKAMNMANVNLPRFFWPKLWNDKFTKVLSYQKFVLHSSYVCSDFSFEWLLTSHFHPNILNTLSQCTKVKLWTEIRVYQWSIIMSLSHNVLDAKDCLLNYALDSNWRCFIYLCW